MKKTFFSLLGLIGIAIGSIAFAAVNPESVARDTAGFIRPIKITDFIKAPYFVATSTSGVSTFAGTISAPQGLNSERFGLGTLAGENSLAVGKGANASVDLTMALGYAAIASTSNTAVFGSWVVPMTSVFFGQGIQDATPTGYTINGTNGHGTDVTGGFVGVQGGIPTGTGRYGYVVLQGLGGNVGIGTTSPSKHLSVVGPAYFASTTGTTTIDHNAQVKGIFQVGTSSIYLKSNATSTFDGGINISTGCFAVNGTCVTGGGGGSTSPGGSDGQIQYNNAGSFAGTSTPTFSAFNSTSTATSTMAGGINVNSGCIAYKGNCITASSTGANTWTGLNTFSRAGAGSLAVGTGSNTKFNMTSGTWSQLTFASAGTDKAALGWDSNGSLYLMSNPFFPLRYYAGSDEMLRVGNTGMIVNGLGNGNSYTMDVRGTLGVSSLSPSGVPFIASGGEFDTDTSQLVLANSLFGVSKTTPTATIHSGVVTRTIGDISGLGNNPSVGDTGYSFGSGTKDYTVCGIRSVNGTDIYSVTCPSINVSEPTVSNYDPTNGSVTEQNGGGYDTTVDSPPSYEIYARYGGSGGVKSNVSLTPSVGSWSGSNPTAYVDVSWSAPVGGSPYDYVVVRNGTDYQTTNNTFITDSNAGWSGGPPSPGALQWQPSLYWTAADNASDYVVRNSTSNTYYLTGGGTSANDTNTWASGSPSNSPNTIDEISLIADGTVELAKLGTAYKFGIFGTTPVIQQTGNLCDSMQAFGFVTSCQYNAGSLNGTVAQNNGGTAATAASYGANRIIHQNGSNNAFNTTAGFVFSAGRLGIGSSTPSTTAVISGTTTVQNLIATSTATSTFGGAITVAAGSGTSTFAAGLSSGALNVTGSATSTFSQGINIAAGCFAVNGTCLTSGGGASQWTTAGSDIYYLTGKVGIGTTSPSSALSVNGTTTTHGLIVGNPGAFANAIVNVATTTAGHLQIALQNRSNANNASADIVATNDIGSDTRYFVNLGINSSTYNQSAFSITGFNDTYLYSSDTALAIGTASTTNTSAVLKFHTGGTTAANERMRITSTGLVGIGTTSPYAALSVVGETVSSYFTATSTTASTTLQGLRIATDLRLDRGFFDSTNSVGTSTARLISTGTSTKWQITPVVQKQRTTGYTLTNTFADVFLDTTNVETDSSILSASTTATSTITVNKAGFYEIHYHGDCAQGTTINDCEAKVVKNAAATLVAGSEQVIKNSSSDRVSFSITTVTYLNAGEYVKVQARFPASTGGIISRLVLLVKQI